MWCFLSLQINCRESNSPSCRFRTFLHFLQHESPFNNLKSVYRLKGCARSHGWMILDDLAPCADGPFPQQMRGLVAVGRRTGAADNIHGGSGLFKRPSKSRVAWQRAGMLSTSTLKPKQLNWIQPLLISLLTPVLLLLRHHEMFPAKKGNDNWGFCRGFVLFRTKKPCADAEGVGEMSAARRLHTPAHSSCPPFYLTVRIVKFLLYMQPSNMPTVEPKSSLHGTYTTSCSHSHKATRCILHMQKQQPCVTTSVSDDVKWQWCHFAARHRVNYSMSICKASSERVNEGGMVHTAMVHHI